MSLYTGHVLGVATAGLATANEKAASRAVVMEAARGFIFGLTV